MYNGDMNSKVMKKQVIKKKAVKTARRSSVVAVRKKKQEDSHPLVTYDTTVGEVDCILGRIPGKNADMKMGVYLKKIGYPSAARILKLMTYGHRGKK